MHDVSIIGAGPIGLYSAYYCGFQKLSAVVLEALSHTGGQLTNIYKDKYIYDLPGFNKITAGDFIKALENQYNQFHSTIPIFFNQAVKDVKKREDGTFLISTGTGFFESRTVLIAAGGGEFRHRPLGVKNAKDYANIQYTMDAAIYTNKNVVVLGGGDAAVDFALMLENIATSVTLVHRKNDFRAHEHSVELLKSSSVRIFTPYVVESVEGDGELAHTLHLQNAEEPEGTRVTINGDVFLVNYGFLPSSWNFENWGLQSTNDGITVTTECATSIPGIFAVGNCAVYPGKMKTITSGLGEVPKATTAIKRYLNPGKNIGTVYSSVVGDKK